MVHATTRTREWVLGAAAASALAGLLLAQVLPDDRVVNPHHRGGARDAVQPPAPVAMPTSGVAAGRPSVVMVLLDDFSMELLQTMRSAQRMRSLGADYRHSFVVDSLCCPSRASTFTGQYPHQTGVRLNTPAPGDDGVAEGGWPAFVEHGNLARTVAVRLQRAGYTTGYIGKYLNGYNNDLGVHVPPPIPGWDVLEAVSVEGNDGWGFWVTSPDGDGGTRSTHVAAPPASAPAPEKDRAYVGAYIQRSALRFIREHEADKAPYFLQVAPLAPHSRTKKHGHYPGDPYFPAAFRDRPGPRHPTGNCGLVACRDLTLRDLPGYGQDRSVSVPTRSDGVPSAGWKPDGAVLNPSTAVRMLRDRARMVQSVDRMLRRILAAVGNDTYVILTSDNGYHLGQNGMHLGKGTAYTSDIRVPLLVVGPGVRPGARRELVTNLDLAPTLEDIAGLQPAAFRSGRSLLPSLARPRLRTRDYVFIEHTWGRPRPGDPDGGVGGHGIGRIPSYVAVRSRWDLLVRYDLDRGDGVDHAYEFYDLGRQGVERRNVFGRPRNQGVVDRMLKQLRAFDACARAAVGDDPVTPDCRALGAANAPRGDALAIVDVKAT